MNQEEGKTGCSLHLLFQDFTSLKIFMIKKLRKENKCS